MELSVVTRSSTRDVANKLNIIGYGVCSFCVSSKNTRGQKRESILNERGCHYEITNIDQLIYNEDVKDVSITTSFNRLKREDDDTLANRAKFIEYLISEDSIFYPSLLKGRKVTLYKEDDTEKTIYYAVKVEGIQDIDFRLLQSFLITTRNPYEKNSRITAFCKFVEDGAPPLIAHYLSTGLYLYHDTKTYSVVKRGEASHFAFNFWPDLKGFLSREPSFSGPFRKLTDRNYLTGVNDIWGQETDRKKVLDQILLEEEEEVSNNTFAEKLYFRKQFDRKQADEKKTPLKTYSRKSLLRTVELLTKAGGLNE